MINERLTKAIAVPTQYAFPLKDGRTLMLTEWSPVLQAGAIVRVNASFVVKDENGDCVPVNGELAINPEDF